MRPRELATLVILAALGTVCAVAQSPEPQQAPGPPDERSWDAPMEPQFPRDFAVRPKVVRKAIVKVIKGIGMSVDEEADEKNAVILTRFALFERDDYGIDVAEEPPRQSPTYPFWQPVKLARGYYRLHFRLEPIQGGTRVLLTVQLVAAGLNRRTYEHVNLPRTSNGTIEKVVMERLEKHLGVSEPGP